MSAEWEKINLQKSASWYYVLFQIILLNNGYRTTVLTLEQDIQEQEEQRAAEEAMQVRLDQTSALLQKLQQVQSDRLSLTPPTHLSHVVQPSDSEVQLGELVNVIFFIQTCVNYAEESCQIRTHFVEKVKHPGTVDRMW